MMLLFGSGSCVFTGKVLTLGEFRMLTKDMPDDMLIVKEGHYPQIENVKLALDPIGKVIGDNYPFIKAGYEQKFWTVAGGEQVRVYEQLPEAIVIKY